MGKYRGATGVFPMGSPAKFIGNILLTERGDPGDESLRKTMLEHGQRVNPKELQPMTDGRDAKGGCCNFGGKVW